MCVCGMYVCVRGGVGGDRTGVHEERHQLELQARDQTASNRWMNTCGTEEMMTPCLIRLDLISLVAIGRLPMYFTMTVWEGRGTEEMDQLAALKR